MTATLPRDKVQTFYVYTAPGLTSNLDSYHPLAEVLSIKNRFLLLLLLPACKGSFTHVVRLYFLYLFSFFIRKKNVNTSPQSQCRYGSSFSNLLAISSAPQAVDTPEAEHCVLTCCDCSLMYVSCMTLCVTDVRAWSVQHSVCHKKHPRDVCVHVVDLWLHDQPFGFWRTAGTLQQ